MLAVSASEMAQLDRKAIEEIGIPGIVLMENAGRGAALFFEEVIPDLLEKRITIVAGSGNNGGDGFVLARLFWNQGAKVLVVCLRSPEKLKGDALTNFRILEKLGIPVVVWDEYASFDVQWKWILGSDVVVDAILGTGLSSEVRGLYREIIETINTLTIPILAVDVPSGLDSSTGKPLGAAVRALATATFGLPKIGQLIQPGEEYVGRLKVVDIGIPPSVVEKGPINCWWVDKTDVSKWLDPRSPSIHKGRAGHIGVLAGSVGKTGAAALVCEGAARVGAGLVTLFIPSSLNSILEVKLTEAMTYPIAESKEQTPGQAALSDILKFLEGKQTLALGPGITTQPETGKLVKKLLPQVECPMVLDADALNILAGDLKVLKQVSQPLILTPHPGEMARLIKGTTQSVQENRLEVASEFSRQHNVTVVLKGHRTVIASPDGRLGINSSGNPAMASGGMGDILTGMIAGFAAQGFEPFQAASLGVYLHGAAADKVMGNVASRGLLATDLLAYIPSVIGRLEGYTGGR